MWPQTPSPVAPLERPIGVFEAPARIFELLQEKPLKRFFRSLEGVFIPLIKQLFDFRGHFRHSAPMETHAFRLQTPGQRSEGQKRFPISFLGG